MKTCKRCGALHSADKCPRCGSQANSEPATYDEDYDPSCPRDG